MFRIVVVSSLCIIGLLLRPTAASAETIHDAGLWMAFFGQGKIQDDKCNRHALKWWFDGHARFLDDADGFNQSIVRPGIGMALGERSAIWAGYGWIRTSPLAGPDFDESRIWQQWTWSASRDPVTFGLRSRLEQRFLETGDDTGWRFRQLCPACNEIFHSALG